MGKKLNKVKEFLKENKKTIIVGTVTCVAGGVIGVMIGQKYCMNDDERCLLTDFKSFNKLSDGTIGSMAKDVNKAMLGSTHAEVFTVKIDSATLTVRQAAEHMIKVYTERGFDPDTAIITGMVTFDKR